MQTSRRSLLRGLAALPAVAALLTAFRPDRALAAPPAPATTPFDGFRLIEQEHPVALLPRWVGVDYGLGEPTFAVVEIESTADGTMRYRLQWTYRGGGLPVEDVARWRSESLNGQTAEVVAWATDVSPDGMRTTYTVEGR